MIEVFSTRPIRVHGRTGRAVNPDTPIEEERRVSELEKRPLGRTGMDVTVLGFGAMELRGNNHRRPVPMEPGQAAKVLNGVLDAGINFVDTSIDYGSSEAEIGSAIAHRRDEFFLASKAGCPVDAERFVNAEPGPLPHNYSRDNIRAGIEQSLERLKTDHLDLLQLHISPSLSTIENDGVIETLLTLKQEGRPGSSVPRRRSPTSRTTSR